MATGSVDAAGLHGTWRSVRDLANGHFAISSDLGAYRIADVYDGKTRWRVEPSGGSHPLDSSFALRAARTEAWLASLVARGAHGGLAHHGLAGTIVTPRRGLPVTLWFDGRGDLIRAVRPTWFETLETRYSDYRLSHDRRLPFTIVNSEGGNDERISIARYERAHIAPSGSFRAPREPDDTSVPAAGTSVPVAIFPQLVVEALVNGQRMAFVFDSGGHSILTPDAARALGLKSVGAVQSGGTGAGTLDQQDTKVATLQIGDALMRDQHFYVLPLSYSSMERGALPPLAGLLGLEVLERFTVRIDYRAGRLTLLPRDVPVACRGSSQTIRFTDDMPTIMASLDGRAAPFTIDTGNNGSLLLYRHWIQQSGLSSRYDRGMESVSYGAGGASRNWVSYAQSFRMGNGIAITRPMVRTTDDKGGVATSVSEAGNLGTASLANYTLTFDYARSRVCVEYVPGYEPLPFNRTGVRATKEAPDDFLVVQVNEASPGGDAGIRKGDRIVAVDGRSARDLSGGDIALALTQAPGNKVRLRYRRGEIEAETTITLKEMLSADNAMATVKPDARP